MPQPRTQQSRLTKRMQQVLACTLLTIALIWTATHHASHAQTVESVSVSHTESDAPTKRRIGETTTSLLQSQIAGDMAGPSLPMLGPTANLSWQRYLDSYKYPIPENFTRRLEEVRNR